MTQPETTAHPDIPFIDDTETRERRIALAERKGQDYCMFCGRGVKPLANGLPASVHMNVNGTLFPVAEDHEGPDSQGWFSVGPECAKKVPREYVSRG